MLVSFIISSQNKEERLNKTLASLKAQTNQSYEVILIDDEPHAPSNTKGLERMREEFMDNSNLTLVVNNRPQGPSTNWNVGIELSRGDYSCFLKEGDVVNPDFVSKLKQTLDKIKTEPDMIQFAQKHVGSLNKATDNNEKLLASNQIYDLNADHSPFAYLDQSLYGKLFVTTLLKNYRVRFRNSNRFDTLFVYRVLGHAQTFYKMEDVLVHHLTTPQRYSVFDLVNQWPHILNYYRKIGNYKNLSHELNYAYLYQLAYAFLALTKQLNNKQLYRKALNFSAHKMSGKLGKNFKQNKVFQAGKDQTFTEWINNYDNQIASELKRLK